MPVRQEASKKRTPKPLENGVTVKEVNDSVQSGEYTVRVSVRVTKQLAPYESLTVEYGATAPLDVSSVEDQITAGLQKARDLVLDQMLIDIDTIKKAVK